MYVDLVDCECYLNVCLMLFMLLWFGVVLIINENDMVVIDEIKFGDNDMFGVFVVNLIEGDVLIIFID